jgi:arginyl-tRNA synthetase
LELAGLFHSFYNNHRVLNENEALQNARLLLMETTRITINNVLGILGVSAPDQM